MVLLLCFMLATADEPKVLQYAFTPGDTAKYIMTVRLTNSQKKGGKPNPSGSGMFEFKIANVWKIYSVSAEGVADLGQTMTRMRLTKTQGDDEEIIDSAKEGNPAHVQAFLDDMTKGEYRMKICPTGEIVDVVAPDRLKERLKSGLPGKTNLSEQIMAQMVKKSSFILPDWPIEVGGSWHDDANAGNAGVAPESTRMLKFEGPTEHEGRKVLKLTLSVELDPKLARKAKGSTKSRVSEGYVLLDAATRWPVEISESHTVVTISGYGSSRTETELTAEAEIRRKDPK